MSTVNELKEILHRFGLKVTDTRLKVLEVLKNSPIALSHTDITARIHDDKLDKVTLYRTLNSFTERGLAHKVATEERNWLYALHLSEIQQSATNKNHAHFICNQCERIYCLPLEIENTISEMEEIHGFVVISHEYRLHGICPDCN
ncbi:MAG: Fur family transcriptional regulator [Balneolales bacterium]